MSAPGEAQPSQGPQSAAVHDSGEADAPHIQRPSKCKEAEG
jgi:hypothetical protein